MFRGVQELSGFLQSATTSLEDLRSPSNSAGEDMLIVFDMMTDRKSGSGGGIGAKIRVIVQESRE